MYPVTSGPLPIALPRLTSSARHPWRASIAGALFLAAASALSAPPAAQLVYPSVVLPSALEVFAADGAIFDRYGSSTGIDGDRAVIGAPRDDDGGTDTGSVYVRDRNLGGPGAWGQVTKLHAADAADFAAFGQAVAIDGGWIAATAPFRDLGLTPQVGAAYLFSTPGLTQVHKLLPGDPLDFVQFGNAVALDAAAGRALVGAVGWYELFPGQYVGSAYLYDTATGTQIMQLFGAKLMNEQFATAVAIGSGYCAVSAHYLGKGAVYVFSSATGTFLYKLEAADGGAFDQFGISLDIDAGRVAIGAPGNDALFLNGGAIYVYDLATATLLKKVLPVYSGAGVSLGGTVAIDGNEVFAAQPTLNLPQASGGGCGTVHQINWFHNYFVASHATPPVTGLCGESIGWNISYDAGTLWTGDFLNGSGVSSSTGTAWTLQRIPIAFAAKSKALMGIDPLDFTLRAGVPGTPCGMGVVAINGVPIAPVIVGLGVMNATGQWVKNFPSTGASGGVTVTFMAAGFDASSALVFSNPVNVQFF